MSYYSQQRYNFSTHGLQRCRQRLKLKDKKEYEVKEKVYQLIKESIFQFETNRDLYISAGKNTKLYFVINKENNLIITCSPISIEKQMQLMDQEW
jgi:hypothetical protein